MKKTFVAVPIFALAIVVAWAVMPSSSGKRSFDRVQEGMTSDEVLEVFGRPADSIFCSFGKLESGPSVIEMWNCGSGTGAIIEYRRGVVISKHYRGFVEAKLASIRRFLGIQ